MNQQTANTSQRSDAAPRRNSPLGQLILTRLREFYREPEAIFWVYGFPILMTVALGIAFRNKPVERINVIVQSGPGAEEAANALKGHEKFVVQLHDAETAHLRLRTGKTELVVVPTPPLNNGGQGGSELEEPGNNQEPPLPPLGKGGKYEFLYDPTRAESLLARNAVDDALQRAAGRTDPVPVSDRELVEPGGRYIDFLIPGLLGMSVMGGGLWGVGFVIVDMRIRKLLKRFLATPMKKRDFLTGIMLSRLIFLAPDVLFLLVFAWLVFGVVIQGSFLAVVFLILLGSFTFSGVGLLVASRAKTMEAVSGLMNVVMLPMWVLSGIFFSSERFGEAAQPFLKMLPLTPLIDALRAVMLEGQSLASQLTEIGILAAWGVVTFILALRWFRWS